LLSRPVLPLLDYRSPILVRVTPEGGGVCWKLLSEKADACTVVWKTVSPTTSCVCMTSTIHGDISDITYVHLRALEVCECAPRMAEACTRLFEEILTFSVNKGVRWLEPRRLVSSCLMSTCLV